MEHAKVEVINHIECINAYYTGFRLAPSSVHFPETPYVKASVNPKKRKRKQIPVTVTLPPKELLAELELAREHCQHDITSSIPSYILCAQEIPFSNIDVEFNALDEVYSNHTDQDDVYEYKKTLFILPRHSAFFLGDVFKMPPMPNNFRVIVMDPPWENKTVSRGATYKTMPHTQLSKIDVPSLAHPDGCLLAIWVTNKPSYTSYIVDELLPSWGFSYAQTWHWLKVSADGNTVTPLQSMHKLPFEKVILATRGNMAASIDPKIIVSIPLRHSWKPPLEPFLSDLVHDKDAKLEIFARELRHNWTSVGNEVLKFQEMSYFELKE
ncbi:unnamed protein product [Aphanomyces euteiches]